MNLIIGETKVKVYKYKEEVTDYNRGIKTVTKGDFLYDGIFQGFGNYSRGINGNETGVIVMSKDEQVRNCLNVVNIRMVEICD